MAMFDRVAKTSKGKMALSLIFFSPSSGYFSGK